MAEYSIEGPKVVNLTQIDTQPQFAVDTRVVTADTSSNKKRIYRYLQHHTSYTAGKAVVISSVGAMLYEAVNTNTQGLRLAVPQVAITSPTAGPNYGWQQTGGYFDTVGILCVSATANAALYGSATAGSLCTVPTATRPVRIPGANALTNVSADNALAYSQGELVAVDDLLA